MAPRHKGAATGASRTRSGSSAASSNKHTKPQPTSTVANSPFKHSSPHKKQQHRILPDHDHEYRDDASGGVASRVLQLSLEDFTLESTSANPCAIVADGSEC